MDTLRRQLARWRLPRWHLPALPRTLSNSCSTACRTVPTAGDGSEAAKASQAGWPPWDTFTWVMGMLGVHNCLIPGSPSTPGGHGEHPLSPRCVVLSCHPERFYLQVTRD